MKRVEILTKGTKVQHTMNLEVGDFVEYEGEVAKVINFTMFAVPQKVIIRVGEKVVYTPVDKLYHLYKKEAWKVEKK